ncbi:MAG: hypothetical protein Q7N87_00365 [Candidatus Uhrbacteria bacterium]|nr:hypothetical protein [Candidatus Uhrbacteria bacterium]
MKEPSVPEKALEHSRAFEMMGGGVYYTKFETILKAIPTKAPNRTLGVRGGLKLPRTLVSFRHCLASLGNTKEKCSLLS